MKESLPLGCVPDLQLHSMYWKGGTLYRYVQSTVTKLFLRRKQ